MATKFLTDRVAIVTASTKGIGFAIAKKLGMDGASVVVCSRKAKNVDDAVSALRVEGIEAAGVPAHVGISDDRKNLINYTISRKGRSSTCFRYGKLDILVSNAAVNPHHGDLLTITDTQWDKMLQINVRSALQLTQEAVPHLERSGRGSVVFVSSVAAFAPIYGLGPYSVMKTALVGVNKALSQSLSHRNIRVNAIAPGIIQTDFSRLLYDDETKQAELLKSIPLHKLGDADECADAVSFLVSDEAAYMNGETLSINGGMQARM